MSICRQLFKRLHRSSRSSSGISYTKVTSPESNHSHAPVLFLHGLFGSKMNFNKPSKILSSDLKTDCYCLDCRNHGKSKWRDEMSMLDLAEDIVNFTQEMGLEKVNIVGHSLGGKQACLVSSLYPNIVQSSVIVDIFPVSFPVSHLDNVCAALCLLPLSKIQTREEASRILSSQIPSEAERNFILSNLLSVPSKEPGPRWKWRCNIEVITDSIADIRGYPDSTPVSHVRTLFLYGGDSDYMSPARIDRSKELFSNASFQVVEGAGHIVHLEQPSLFYEAVKNFFIQYGSHSNTNSTSEIKELSSRDR